MDESDIDWLSLAMGLFGGLAMFLFGMEQMSEGLKAAAGETLKDVLSGLTKNRFMGGLDRCLCYCGTQFFIGYYRTGGRFHLCRFYDAYSVGGCHHGGKYRQYLHRADRRLQRDPVCVDHGRHRFLHAVYR
jgi:hypothetical protein